MPLLLLALTACSQILVEVEPATPDLPPPGQYDTASGDTATIYDDDTTPPPTGDVLLEAYACDDGSIESYVHVFETQIERGVYPAIGFWITYDPAYVAFAGADGGFWPSTYYTEMLEIDVDGHILKDCAYTKVDEYAGFLTATFELISLD